MTTSHHVAKRHEVQAAATLDFKILPKRQETSENYYKVWMVWIGLTILFLKYSIFTSFELCSLTILLTFLMYKVKTKVKMMKKMMMTTMKRRRVRRKLQQT